MALIDQLREADNLSPSHVPTVGELLELVGKLIAYAEHGDEFLRASERDAEAREAGEPARAVNDLLSPPPPEQEAPAAVPAAAPAAPDDRDARIASLEQQLANAQAQSERTQVETSLPSASSPPPSGPGGP